jgi:poly-beta-1,6-N-acetyl-D-glucosamine synthase
VVPLLLLLMLVASAMIGGAFYEGILLLQLLFYIAATLGSLSPSTTRFKPVAIATTFVMLNIAAALAFCNFVARREKVWV